MSTATVIASGFVVLAVAAGLYFLWPSAHVLKIFRAARQRRAQRSLNGLSMPRLLEEAQAGNASAQYRVGYAYATGDGVPVNYAKANYWLGRAARGGVIDAVYCLALHYERGRGVAANDARAFELYENAAKAGNAAAQCNLGMMYLHGRGIRKNMIEAARWFVLSAAQGEPQASANLHWVIENQAPFAPHEVACAHELERSSERNDADALLVLGWMHATGFLGRRDTALARQLYERAQSRGHLFAHRLLSQLEHTADESQHTTD